MIGLLVLAVGAACLVRGLVPAAAWQTMWGCVGAVASRLRNLLPASSSANAGGEPTNSLASQSQAWRKLAGRGGEPDPAES